MPPWLGTLTLLALIPFAAPAGAQDAAPPGDGPAAQRSQQQQAAAFPTDQLEQLAAPIALYSDELLAHVLMASTYPLEVVSAARWIRSNPDLKGEPLDAALQQQNWDPSVKSLCAFPEVLARMDENLDWMKDLGDAVLSQQAELMDAVQRLRGKAHDAGTIESDEHQKVTEQQDGIIVIESADPEVVYVPTYYPSACYGSWGYPHWYYPPLYPPPPAGGLWFGFTVGVIWGSAWGGCGWGWGHTEIDIDIDRQNNFIDRTERPEHRQQVKDRAARGAEGGRRGTWQHDATHRGGVGYRDKATAQRFERDRSQPRVSRDQARGYGDRGTARDRSSSGRAGDRPQVQSRDSRDRSLRSSGERSGSFSGSRSRGFDRAGSLRGSRSRGSFGGFGGGGRRGGRR